MRPASSSYSDHEHVVCNRQSPIITSHAHEECITVVPEEVSLYTICFNGIRRVMNGPDSQLSSYRRNVSFPASAFSSCTMHNSTIDLKRLQPSIQTIARTYLPNYHFYRLTYTYKVPMRKCVTLLSDSMPSRIQKQKFSMNTNVRS